MPAFVKFWGTRGSIPTPALWTRVYGGNTSCVEIRMDDTLFICDAGSGIRELGKDLLTRNPVPNELHLFLTHTHWDHIQGFPFFVPAYRAATRMRIYGPAAGDDSRYQLLSGQMASDYFPVAFGEMGAKITPEFLTGGEKKINGVRVRSFPLNHPGSCCGYIFEKGGVKIVYATDNELPIQSGDRFPDLQHTGGLRQMPASLIEAVQDADLLITDAQYDDLQYVTKRGWGHSSCNSVTDLAIKAKVKNLALFHHDPESTDRDLDAKAVSCQKRAAKHNADVIVFCAREGVELKF